MRKVIGFGETVYDIIFDAENRPISAKPGGSAYNALISLGRKGVDATFISEVGNDKIGGIIKSFLVENGVDASNVCMFDNTKSPLALAFLDSNKNAQYTFYKDYSSQRVEFESPQISPDDILLIGSYFAISPVLRSQVKRMLEHARRCGAIIYYDVNFRATHKSEVDDLKSAIFENFEFADIVKGSDEDFEIMFGTSDWRSVYHDFIAPRCKMFICTQGAKGATLMIGNSEWSVEAKEIVPVSTVGAGDNFNAGTVYGLMTNGVLRSDLHSEAIANLIVEAMRCGVEFATEVCLSLDNYIAK